jgi:hypothetical protein
VTPKTSIVLINKDDPAVLTTLAALVDLPEVQSGEAEIVVVDASQGRLAPPAPAPLNLIWVPFTPQPGRITIAQQRNVGIAAARGEVIAFIDASCIPGPDWLPSLCGPIWSGDETIVAGSSQAQSGSGFRDQAIVRLRGVRYLPEAPTINLALHGSVFERLGGFDERFAYGSDVDFTWRAVDAGLRIRYIPEAVVSHDWGTDRQELHRSWRYGRARARLYLKHRERWRDLLGRDSPLLVYPVYLLLLPVTVRRPYLHLALIVPLIRNRGKQPVRAIIDHFIYGAGGLVEAGAHAARRAPR